jgi:hypothetical protein
MPPRPWHSVSRPVGVLWWCAGALVVALLWHAAPKPAGVQVAPGLYRVTDRARSRECYRDYTLKAVYCFDLGRAAR